MFLKFIDLVYFSKSLIFLIFSHAFWHLSVLAHLHIVRHIFTRVMVFGVSYFCIIFTTVYTYLTCCLHISNAQKSLPKKKQETGLILLSRFIKVKMALSALNLFNQGATNRYPEKPCPLITQSNGSK